MPSAAKSQHWRHGRSFEDRALETLIGYVRGLGRTVELVGRPDREGNVGRAVDAELMVDGAAVGVEVTQLLPGARDHYEIARLERAIEDEIRPLIRELALQYVAIGVHYRDLPPKRELRAARPVLAGQIASAMRTLAALGPGRQEVEVATGVEFVRRLNLIHLPASRPGLGWIGGSDAFGGWIVPLADEYVEHLLASKGTQAEAFSIAWILIVDRVGLLAERDLADALRRQAERIPTNWRAMWLIPATDRSTVRAVPLPSDHQVL